jgi:hypothetical protein
MLYVSDGGVGDFRSTVRKGAGAVGRAAKTVAKQTGRAVVKSAGNELGNALRRLTGGSSAPAASIEPEAPSILPWVLGAAAVAGGAFLLTRGRR